MTEARPTYHPAQKTPERQSTRILSDRARCHDAQCRVHQLCARWLTRHDGEYLLHATTLRDAWLPRTDPCTAYLGPPLAEGDD